MREKYMTLSLATLRELAKARGMKGITALKKDQLIDRMVEEDEKDNAMKQESQPKIPDTVTEKEENTPPVEEAPVEKKTNRVFNGRAMNQQDMRRRPSNAGGDTRTASGNSNDNRTSYGTESRSTYVNARSTYQERPSSYDRPSYDRPSYDRPSYDRPSNQDRGGQPVRNVNAQNARPAYSPNRPAPQPAARPAPAPRPVEPQESQIQEQIREADAQLGAVKEELSSIDSGNSAVGILEIHQDGYGFLRSANYMPGECDVYISPSQIRRFNLKTGDIVKGNTRVKTEKEKFSALLYVESVNGYHPSEAQRRPAFEDLTPIFPNERIYMERPNGSIAMRIVDEISPIGKGQRGMIVSQPKAGKTTLLKEIAKSVTYNNPEMHLIILLIDERPEEVTDIKEAIEGDNVEVIYSTFDELPEHHKRVSEMVIERAKRLVEHKQDVMILLDSITRLARAYNLTIPASGRTLSGGLDPAALHMPKRFFGAARNMREGGSLTILATALVETGSKMDDVVFEEFKGTGNMELVLDRKLSEKRIFPAIDIVKSGTRRDDLLLTPDEQQAIDIMRRAFNSMKGDEAVETILNMFTHTKNNADFVSQVRKNRIF